MPREIELKILPKLAYDDEAIARAIVAECKIEPSSLSGFNVLKRSIDARKKPIQYFLRLDVFIDEEFHAIDYPGLVYQDVRNAEPVHIIGMGPAGMFAALKCISLGLKPLIIERGKDVRERRRDLAKITRDHIVNPESNYCFGEGGAGTYSDGKLYTRSKKRGDLLEVLNTLVQHGADPYILQDAHPHIGTNKLPKIIEEIRATILEHGGEIHFNTKLTDIHHKDNKIESIELNGETTIPCTHLILATGHSARDIFYLLDKKHIKIEAKPFALGVRIEHPQEVIDQIQYKCDDRGEYLPPASYNLVKQVNGRGVYSFCMCPGGIIAPCATNQDEVVTNGWSPSKRDNEHANSGFVTEIGLQDMDIDKYGALAGVEFQKAVEHKAWVAAGKTQKVPAQRALDFLNKTESKDLPSSSYLPGIVSVNLWDVLPDFVAKSIAGALRQISKHMPKYVTNDAVLHAVESRTSSPVRIPRDKESLQHVEIEGLYPCGEGAGYAGGIVSAAVDGIRCVKAIKLVCDGTTPPSKD